ncbi:zinc finger CCCH domain-containing protein 55 isoform X5 [Canna indica]|uniref:Zinc finger CCCH domain-containing protein 55 isoform X5 n=1 Tax=Canna indica TaxID=4628 RepID=A0AAQ3K788_9LILI|nr:zinc finger CCCH domain-containing protein 55 isoform X5 [Canna indica]
MDIPRQNLGNNFYKIDIQILIHLNSPSYHTCYESFQSGLCPTLLVWSIKFTSSFKGSKMTENVRRRQSKWDMAVEPNFPGETRDDNAYVKANYTREKELQSVSSSVNPDSEQFSLQPDMKSNSTLKTDISQEDVTMRPSEGFSHMDRSPKPEQDEVKNSFEGLDSENQTVKDVEVSREMGGRDPASIQEYNSGKSPDRDAWRRRSHNVSPRGVRGRPGRSWSRSQSRSRSRSRSRSWSQSRSHSRSRSRSRSPFGMKRGSDRWSGRGRNRAGGQVLPCRDFAAGRCRRGSQCRFLHEDAGRAEFDRYQTHSKEIKPERGSSWRNDKENLTASWDQSDYSRNKPLQRQRSHYDDGDRVKPESHRINKPTELCFDFTKGRCQRGSSCRYLHHEASSRGGWSVKDDTGDDNYDRRDQDASFGQRIGPRRVNEQPCKFFAEGRCRNGQNCRFSHQGVDNTESRSRGGRWDYDQITGDSSSKTASNLGDQTVVRDSLAPSHWISGNDCARATASQSLVRGDSTRPQHRQSRTTEDDDYQTLQQQVHKKADSQVHDKIQEVAGQHQHGPAVSLHGLDKSPEVLRQEGGSVIPGHSPAKPETKHVVSVMGQSFAQSGSSQFISPPQLHAQNFAPSIQIPQVVAPLPFSGQMQQVVYPVPPNGQSQFVVPPTPSDAQQLNLSMQSQPTLSLQNAVQNQQNPGKQTQHNSTPTNPNGPGQQNSNLSANNPQLLLSSLNGQSQHSLHPHVQIQQNVLPLNGLIGQNQQSIVPPQDNQESLQSLGTMNHNHALEPPLDQSLSSASAITNKIVTSEQAARITDLSASLARFFGNAPLSVSTLGMPVSQHTSSSSATLPEEAIPRSVQPSQGSANVGQRDAISDNTLATQAEPSGDNPVKELNGTESGQAKNEEKAHPLDANIDAADGENKQTKDAKVSKMFKYALAEYVKELLKPAWKEGQLSREAHKTIVKKVVDKVTSAIQGPNIPQTQEKIDVYLAHSKTKLSKLVQAYVEKYVKN